MKATSGVPFSPRTVTRHAPGELPPYLSNGLMGIRPGLGPPINGVAIANGFVGIDPMTGVEGFARAPYPLALDFSVDGVRMSEQRGRCVLREQRYGFASGELKTEFAFDAGGRTVEVRLLQWCSRTHPTVCAQQADVHVSEPCDFELSVGIDPDAIPGTWAGRNVQPSESADGLIVWRSHGGLSRCGGAYASELAGAEAEPSYDRGETNPLKTTYRFRARSSRRYRVRQLTSTFTEALHPQPQLQAVRLLHAALAAGFERVREENKRAWKDLWPGRPILVGAPARWQALMDAAFFYLHTSAHPSSPCSTSMFGLAYWPDYHYYRGHVMWDIETFAVPPLLYRSGLSAGAARLPDRQAPGGPRERRREWIRGAQYPWESRPPERI